MKPVVLWYKVDKAKISRLRPVLSLMGVELRDISGSALSDRIGYLACPEEFENTAEQPIGGSAPGFEFMLFCGMEKPMLDKVLDFMKKNRLNVSNKAMLTETNADWSLGRLLGEINAERQMIAAQLKSKKNN